MQKAAPALLAQPVAFAADGDDVAVVEHPVEDSSGDDCVSEDTAPLSYSPVRCDEQRTALIAAADQLEEQMRRVRFKRQIAEFIYDEQLWLAKCVSFSSSLPSAWALAKVATSVMAGTKRTV